VIPLEWFQLLYGAEMTNGWLTISFKRDASNRGNPDDPFATEWFHVQNLELAAQRAEELTDEFNLYHGVGLRRARLANGQRGASCDVGILPGFWVEVDVAGPTHDGTAKKYFQTKTEAQVFLEGLPHRPSVVVDSGGGLHAYWLFRELWEFEADEQEYAAALLRGWQGIIRAAAVALGYHVDYTHDLARVLRVVGTLNHKGKKASRIEILTTAEVRYNPGDFEQWADWSETSVRAVPRGFEVRPGAQPPADKFAALLTNDRKFQQSWEEARKDLKDQTPSAYALSLATMAAAAGWADQEIVNLLIAFREKKPRANKKQSGWYARTVAKARQGQEVAADQAQAAERLAVATEPDEKLAGLSSMLGFQIRRLVRKRPIDPSRILMDAWYVIETEQGSVEVIDADTLISLQRMRSLLVDKLNLQIKVKARDWPAVVDAMLAVMVTEDAPIESSPYEEIRTVLMEYAEHKSVCDDPVKGHDGDMLVRLDGKVWFNLARFGEWCRIRKNIRVGPRNLPGMLEAIGCKRKSLHNLKRGSQRTMLNLWSLPEVQ
jgi:hypothetical protein